MTRWALVAGASRGIGLATARLLAEEGWSLVVSARNTEKIPELLADVPEERLKCLPFDFRELEKIRDYASQVTEITGGISAMLYASGAQRTLPLAQSKPSISEELFCLNTFAAFEMVRLFSRKGAYGAEGASFVLISSLAAHEGALGKALYGASKGALEGFIPAAAAELAPKRIRLNAVTLGVVETEMSGEFLSRMSEEQLVSLKSAYPLGLGAPEDAANVIAFLLSEKARWITGQKIVADGGHTVRGS